MYCHYIGWCIGKCPLYRGVLYQRFYIQGRNVISLRIHGQLNSTFLFLLNYILIDMHCMVGGF